MQPKWLQLKIIDRKLKTKQYCFHKVYDMINMQEMLRLSYDMEVDDIYIFTL